jgi:hypothetical protein
VALRVKKISLLPVIQSISGSLCATTVQIFIRRCLGRYENVLNVLSPGLILARCRANDSISMLAHRGGWEFLIFGFELFQETLESENRPLDAFSVRCFAPRVLIKRLLRLVTDFSY